MKLFKETPKIPFIRHRYLLLAFSGILVASSLFLLFQRGINYGTDFLGGVKLQYQLPSEIREGEIRNLLGNLGLGDISVVRYGNPEERRIVVKVSKPSEEMESLASLITPKLVEAYGEEGLILEQDETVGPKVGSELRRKGKLAVLFTLFCMLIYIGFRFDFHFAPGAILALFHDVLVILGVFSLFQMEFSLTILAACLTIVGYSINDTIVIFDRVREHARLITPASIEEVVNTSINETLTRTIFTTWTTFIVVLILYLFGGSTIKDFAFALLIGILSGTYSTLSIACPLYIEAYRLTPRIKLLSGKKG